MPTQFDHGPGVYPLLDTDPQSDSDSTNYQWPAGSPNAYLLSTREPAYSGVVPAPSPADPWRENFQQRAGNSPFDPDTFVHDVAGALPGSGGDWLRQSAPEPSTPEPTSTAPYEPENDVDDFLNEFQWQPNLAAANWEPSLAETPASEDGSSEDFATSGPVPGEENLRWLDRNDDYDATILDQLAPAPRGYAWALDPETGNTTQRELPQTEESTPATNEPEPNSNPPTPASAKDTAAVTPESAPVEPTIPATPPSPDPTPAEADFAPTLGANLRKGTYDTAAAVVDGARALGTGPGRQSFFYQDQKRLDDLWKARDAMEALRQQALERARAQYPAGLLGQLRYYFSPERAEALHPDLLAPEIDASIRRLSNNPGWWDAARNLRQEGQNSYELYGVDPDAQNFSAKAGRFVADLVQGIAYLPTGDIGIVSQSLGQAYGQEYERAEAELRAQGITDPVEIDARADARARQKARDDFPMLLAGMAANRVARAGKAREKANSPTHVERPKPEAPRQRRVSGSMSRMPSTRRQVLIPLAPAMWRLSRPTRKRC
jgi:hypothetical protein